MVIVDANAILRYILMDNLEMANKVEKLIEENKICVKYEVIAEVIYVLEKVYKISREKIVGGLNIFINLENIKIDSPKVLALALNTYKNVKIDFVDTLLYSYKAVENIDVFTFDKKLNTLISKL